MPWGRVGSNLVNGIVAGTRRLRVWNEPLTGLRTRCLAAGGSAQEVWDLQAAWVAEHLLAGDGDRFVNLAADSVERPEALRDLLAPLRPVFLVLDRRDDLATAVSALRMEAWVREGLRAGEARGWALPRGQRLEFRPHIPPDRLSGALATIARGRAALELILGEGARTRYFYEDLLADLPGVAADVLARCGLPAYDFEVRSARFGADRLAEMVANPGEIAAFARARGVATRLLHPGPGAAA